ncbi:MAG: class D beta-lactamase [Anaerolineae bacterium]|nr:class D beta-lactamase [Anaerolineae bacterium]
MIRKIACLSLILSAALAACCAPAPTLNRVTSQDLSPFFEGYHACFVLWDVAADEYVTYNPERCAERLSPCSTYKIPHSLIALETGVVPDQHHVIAWDGTQYPVEVWNQDHTMASAVQNSVVWYFQAVATEIGEEQMQAYLDKFGYGNQDISGGLTRFWLGSSLEISADEQIDFLHRLDTSDLPVSQRSSDIVKEVLVLEETEAYVYRGKTGSCTPEGEHPLGWFVGYVSYGGRSYIFATNIQGAKAEGQKARSITEDVLQSLNLLQ